MAQKDIFLTAVGRVQKENAGPRIAEGREATRHRIRIKLLWHLGEFELLPEDGIPYRESVNEKPPLLDNLRAAIEDELINDEEVVRVRDLTFDLDVEDRSLSIEAAIVDTESNTITVNGEVDA